MDCQDGEVTNELEQMSTEGRMPTGSTREVTPAREAEKQASECQHGVGKSCEEGMSLSNVFNALVETDRNEIAFPSIEWRHADDDAELMPPPFSLSPRRRDSIEDHKRRRLEGYIVRSKALTSLSTLEASLLDQLNPYRSRAAETRSNSPVSCSCLTQQILHLSPSLPLDRKSSESDPASG